MSYILVLELCGLYAKAGLVPPPSRLLQLALDGPVRVIVLFHPARGLSWVGLRSESAVVASCGARATPGTSRRIGAGRRITGFPLCLPPGEHVTIESLLKLSF